MLPGSKSESNRALMIAAYGGFLPDVGNLSEAHDTVLLETLLKAVENNPHGLVDCEDAGTVSRFLMTYLASTPGEWQLTGSDRLRQRPMAPLIETLRQLGADIVCEEVEGFLPVRIRGKKLRGGQVQLDASKSSQFVTSLLLAAPTWEEGLRLSLTDGIVSEPYINMTLAMMEHFGIKVVRDGEVITIAHQPYCPCRFNVSADWSAASYWYEMLALCGRGSLLLKGLQCNTLQGDAQVARFFKPLGIQTAFVEDGVRITSEGLSQCVGKRLEFDLSDTPDLFPSILVTCVVLHIETVFYGISTLFNKESDRVNSLITELSKIYTFNSIIEYNKLVIGKSSLSEFSVTGRNLSFNTYSDHRLVMALAGLKMVFDEASVNDCEVVNKSYPKFWNELKKYI